MRRRRVLTPDADAVPITPIDWHPAKEIPLRRNVHEWFAEAQEHQTSKDAKLELSLFIPAMAKFQRLGLEDQLSYFRIAGIHGSPPNVSWNMGREPIPYDSPDMEERKKKGQGGNYCPHNKFVFPTWHRAYLMLFEVGSTDWPLAHSMPTKLMACIVESRPAHDGRGQDSQGPC